MFLVPRWKFSARWYWKIPMLEIVRRDNAFRDQAEHITPCVRSSPCWARMDERVHRYRALLHKAML